jgi:ABC-type transporter Mla subunit MlaD
MSSSLAGATKSSRDVAENIRTVARVSHNTSQGTADLEKAAAEVSQTSTDLHDLVSQFRPAQEETVDPTNSEVHHPDGELQEELVAVRG